MAALMVLFLVAMSVALLAVTKKVSEEEREDKDRLEAIATLMEEIRMVVSAKEFEGVRVIGNTIDFGPRGRFEKEGQNTLSPPQRDLIRQFTPKFLDKLRTTDAGKRWFKRAVVEGYASQSGKYLFNLNLSLERSARVLCELLRDPLSGEQRLSFHLEPVRDVLEEDQAKGDMLVVRRLHVAAKLVGGFEKGGFNPKVRAVVDCCHCEIRPLKSFREGISAWMPDLFLHRFE
jgi:hypothetical protein